MTLIGIISDSHGRAAATELAARLLVERGAELLIHLGDVGSEQVIDALIQGVDAAGKVTPPVHLVFGNTDWDAAELGEYARHVGVQVDHPAGRLTIDGKTLAFTHGDEPRLMQQAVVDRVDYLFHGHTHKTRDQVIGSTRVINPGALHRAAQHTAALLDVAGGRLEFVHVPEV